MSNEQKKSEHARDPEEARQSDDPFSRETKAEAPKASAGAEDEVPPSEAGPQADASAGRIRDLEERLKRAVAEQENVRKRMEREKEDIARYAMANFAREVLGIADNIQRAIQAVPRDAAERDAALKTFLDGIEVTERELHKAMERHGIVRLNPEGEKFDPNFHQAIFEVPTPDKPSGIVMQVMQPGYMLGERVLRPAMVGVSKSAPAASGANENTPQEGEAKSRSEPDALKPVQPTGEQRSHDKAVRENETPSASRQTSASGQTSASRQTCADRTEPESAIPAASQPRGTSRLNEPVINTETERAFGPEEGARRKR